MLRRCVSTKTRQRVPTSTQRNRGGKKALGRKGYPVESELQRIENARWRATEQDRERRAKQHAINLENDRAFAALDEERDRIKQRVVKIDNELQPYVERDPFGLSLFVILNVMGNNLLAQRSVQQQLLDEIDQIEAQGFTVPNKY